MSNEYVGRKHDEEYYRYKCDVEGCDNRRTFTAENTDRVCDWNVARMFEDGIVTDSRHICPEHD